MSQIFNVYFVSSRYIQNFWGMCGGSRAHVDGGGCGSGCESGAGREGLGAMRGLLAHVRDARGYKRANEVRTHFCGARCGVVCASSVKHNKICAVVIIIIKFLIYNAL